MTDFPHEKFYLVVKGDVAFVKCRDTGITVGVWKNGEYYAYTTAHSKKQSERDKCNGVKPKGG